MPTWLPDREADRLTWLQNFALKLNVYVGTAGIVAGDVTNVNGYRDLYLWIINRTDQIRTVSQDLTEWKRLLSDGLVQQILDPETPHLRAEERNARLSPDPDTASRRGVPTCQRGVGACQPSNPLCHSIPKHDPQASRRNRRDP